MDEAERAKELLTSLEYINIATVSPEGLPWNTPVYGQHDEQLHIYWSSWKDAQHSLNIKNNENVFMTIYDSTRKRGDNNRRCLYLQAEAYEIEEPSEIPAILDLLYPEDETERNASNFHGKSVRRLYKAVTKAVWLNDKSERQVTNETIKMRVDVSMQRLLERICS